MFLHQGAAIIGDFGFAKRVEEFTTSRLGTPYNMAPELLLNRKVPYNSKIDIWAIGVAFYRMIHGILPFPAKSLDELKQVIKYKSGKQLYFNPGLKIPSAVKDLIVNMLEYDPNKRISWVELFNHPCLNDMKNSMFVPQYNINTMTESVNQERNINEDGLNPTQKRDRVNMYFNHEKQRAAAVS